jgi:uncharacterized protein (DUF924 family)
MAPPTKKAPADMTDLPANLAPADVLSFWFSDEAKKHWFERSDAFDVECRDRFGPAAEAARSGALDGWAETAEGALALLILLDQVPRNIFRGTPGAFASDEKALAVAKAAVDRGFDAAVPADRRTFFYLPFQHSELLADQERGMELYAASDIPDGMRWMKAHRDIVARFGRFPHRNAILGRTSTPEELEFLQQPGSSF